jgi:hypothetical protein
VLAKGVAMSFAINADDPCGLDQDDDKVLALDFTDEDLEAAGDLEKAFPTASINIVPPNCC